MQCVLINHWGCFFDNGIANLPETGEDTLEQWLAKPIVMTSMDSITYWLGMLAANHLLAQMALDYCR